MISGNLSKAGIGACPVLSIETETTRKLKNKTITCVSASELDTWLEKFYKCNEFFQFVLTMGPNRENIDELATQHAPN